MYIALSIVHVLIASGLILMVLLQSGKGADIGAAFGGGSSQTVFGGRGAATFLSKATTVLAVLFMVMSIALTLLASQRGGTTVVPEERPKPASSAPAVPASRRPRPRPRPRRPPRRNSEPGSDLHPGPSAAGTDPDPRGAPRRDGARRLRPVRDAHPVPRRRGGAGLRRHAGGSLHRRHQRPDPEYHQRLRLPRDRQSDLLQPRPHRQDARSRGGAGGALGHLEGRDDHHLSPAERGEVARRGRGHGGGRRFHLPLHDRPEDPDGLRGAVPAGAARRDRGPLHLPGHLRPAVRARPPLVGDLDPAAAHPGARLESGRGSAHDPTEPFSRRQRSVSVPASGRRGRRSCSKRIPTTSRAART